MFTSGTTGALGSPVEGTPPDGSGLLVALLQQQLHDAFQILWVLTESTRFGRSVLRPEHRTKPSLAVKQTEALAAQLGS